MGKTDATENKEGMTLYEDSRQQVGKHRNVEAYCQRMGIEIVRKKLDVGDYMLPGGKVSVDTKENIMEICRNVMSDDHRRLKAEILRANELGIQLIFLVEELPPFGRLDLWEVPRWQRTDRFHKYGDPMTRVHPATLRRALITMQERYGVKFRFCTRRQSPARIIKYLKGELK